MAEVLFISVTVVVVILLGTVIARSRYVEDAPEFSPVEIEWLKEEAEGRISDLSSRVMALAELERAVNQSMDLGDGYEESRFRAEELLVEAAADDFWGRFVTASALVEENPVEALEELGRLPGLLEETIRKLERAERLSVRRRTA
jgi:hypothetical protein